jgi:hypothetical protein
LVQLLKLLHLAEPSWMPMEPALKRLTDFAVTVRYPGTTTNRTSANSAFTTCRKLRTLARTSLGLKP